MSKKTGVVKSSTTSTGDTMSVSVGNATSGTMQAAQGFCWFGHKWTRWYQTGEQQFQILNGGGRVDWVREVQRRHCLRCGYVEQQEV